MSKRYRIVKELHGWAEETCIYTCLWKFHKTKLMSYFCVWLSTGNLHLHMLLKISQNQLLRISLVLLYSSTLWVKLELLSTVYYNLILWKKIVKQNNMSSVSTLRCSDLGWLQTVTSKPRIPCTWVPGPDSSGWLTEHLWHFMWPLIEVTKGCVKSWLKQVRVSTFLTYRRNL